MSHQNPLNQAGRRVHWAERELLSSQPWATTFSLFSHNIIGKTAHPIAVTNFCLSVSLIHFLDEQWAEPRHGPNVSLERSVILPIGSYTGHMYSSESPAVSSVCSSPQVDRSVYVSMNVQICIGACTCVYVLMCADQRSVSFSVILHLRFWDRSLNGT